MDAATEETGARSSRAGAPTPVTPTPSPPGRVSGDRRAPRRLHQDAPADSTDVSPLLPAFLPPGWRTRGACAPQDLYVAVRVDRTGTVVGAVGPFLDAADARSHVATAFDGHGFAVPFTLTFRSPPPPP